MKKILSAVAIAALASTSALAGGPTGSDSQDQSTDMNGGFSSSSTVRMSDSSYYYAQPVVVTGVPVNATLVQVGTVYYSSTPPTVVGSTRGVAKTAGPRRDANGNLVYAGEEVQK